MGKLFTAEQELLDRLLEAWYASMEEFTKRADGVFSDKGKQYDRESPVWERVRFPHGFVQELRKKTDRLRQLLADYDPSKPFAENGVDWSFDEGVLEELVDIMNYSRMMGALILMKGREKRND
jgi:hypothetical protein